ncbi:hypothetical protein [Vibrio cincinnatiensis]|jgi:hypothetical protein|uniref:Uncharacterized protein n=1 Tax=Vibrio cincinnatiensis DSM 19608 TaxID=1123491 RepID=A0A1T4N4H1_VIBCI|nr:hypothetical protein [Vibrio cincinnatiensis]SJZ74001.1 hypothetical protein SAMN02745782_01209 [Vibrio cincinnatiensis DSM 19608]SUP49224.1 Uncharacterised protein [Vibrio cincinnatiensis]
MRALMSLSVNQASQATTPRMPVPNRHVKGQGHHRVPQPSKHSK